MRPIHLYIWLATGSLGVSATFTHSKEKNQLIRNWPTWDPVRFPMVLLPQTPFSLRNLFGIFADMIEAGISFYTKLINKNNAIRELTGEEADARWFGFRTTPIEKRKKFLESKLTGTRREPEQVPVGNNVARNQHATLP